MSESLKTSPSCPLCKSQITKRSLNPSSSASELVNAYNSMVLAYELDCKEPLSMTRQWIEQPLSQLSQLFPYPTKWKNSFEDTPSFSTTATTAITLDKQSSSIEKTKRKLFEIDRELENIEEQLDNISDYQGNIHSNISDDDINDEELLAFETYPTDLDLPSTPDLSQLRSSILGASPRCKSTKSSVSVQIPVGKKSPVLLASHLNSNQKKEMSRLAAELKWTIATEYNASVTHLVVNTDNEGRCRRTLKYLLALLNRKWIVDANWIRCCLYSQQRADESEYTVRGDEVCHDDIPMKIRLDGGDPLFSGLSFHMYGEFDVPTVSDLKSLIIAGGGSLVESIEGLKGLKKTKTVVICDIVVQNSFEKGAAIIAKFKPLISSQWILDCISHWELIDNKYYIAF